MATNLTIATPASFAIGKFGKALVLNGGGGGCATGGKIPASGSVTMEFWLKATAPGGGLTVVGGQQLACWIGIENTGNIRASHGSATTEATINGPVVTDGQWHHIEHSWGAFGAALFVDGALVGSSSVSDTDAGVQRAAWNIVLGKFEQYANYYYTGQLDEVAVWAGRKHTAAFTPPASPYDGTESNLAYLYHLNDDGVDSVSTSPTPSPTVIDRNNAAIMYAPYVWQDTGTARVANTNGAYLKFAFTGTKVGLNLEGLAAQASYPVLRAFIDNAPPIDVALTQGQTYAEFSASLASGSHTITIGIAKSNGEGGWWSLAHAVKITGIVLANGATVSAVERRSKNMIFYGDSLTQGVRVFSTTAVAGDDAFRTEAGYIAKALNAELGQVGFGSTSFTQGNGDVPQFNTHYSLYSNGSSRLVNGVLSPAVDYIAFMHGTNGNTSQAAVATAISNCRAIGPAAKIFAIVPPGGFGRSAITAAVNAARSAGDLNVHLIDAGSGEFQAGLAGANNDSSFALGSPNAKSTDTIHPYAHTNAELAPEHMRQITRAIEPRRFNVVAS